MTKLTPKELDAVIDVLNERIAGGEDDLRDALGLTTAESKLVMNRLERALDKLSAELEERGGAQ